jgi:hypothetical protein
VDSDEEGLATTKPAPAAEINIDSPVVHALLEEQHPALASLDLVAVGEGWDNLVFHLGEELVVRKVASDSAASARTGSARARPRDVDPDFHHAAPDEAREQRLDSRDSPA